MSMPVRARTRLATGGRLSAARRTVRPLLAPVAVVVVSSLAGLALARIVALSSARDVLFLVLGGVIAGIGLLRPSFSIVATVAGFVFLSTLRRLAPAPDPAADLAAIVPFLIALPLVVRGLRAPKPAAFSLFLIWISASAGLAFSRPLVSVAGWMNVVVPLAVALALAEVPDGLRTFARAVVGCGAVAASYGIVQYFVPLAWDLEWLEQADLVSAGIFGTSTFRPFATLPAPTTAATLCAVVILVVVFKRSLVALPSVVLVWAVSACTVLLLLTQVRSVWLALAVALVVGALATRGHSLVWTVAPVAVVVGVLAWSPQAEVIVDRAQTLADPQGDVSFQSRVTLLGRAAELTSPLGRGVGSLSAGSRATADQSIDNGYLVVLGELGLVGVVLFGWVLVLVVRRSRPADYAFLALLAALSAAAFALGGLGGLLLWALSGLSRPQDQPARGEPTAARRGLFP